MIRNHNIVIAITWNRGRVYKSTDPIHCDLSTHSVIGSFGTHRLRCSMIRQQSLLCLCNPNLIDYLNSAVCYIHFPWGACSMGGGLCAHFSKLMKPMTLRLYHTMCHIELDRAVSLLFLFLKIPKHFPPRSTHLRTMFVISNEIQKLIVFQGI